jgi:hypothetical protein
MPKKKNRSFRSGSTQHYEEKLFEPLDIEQEKAENVFQVLKIFCFFSSENLLTRKANRLIENTVLCSVQVVLSLHPDSHRDRGGKSGQHRAPYFLTGRLSSGD